jgi:hypothetical protein
MYMLKMSLTVMFHPIDAFEYIKKDRSKFNYLPILILLFLAMAVRAFAIYVTHFPLAKIQPRDASIVLEAVKLVLPILTWVLASYAMTTIIDGETLLRETLLAVAYSMLPYILFTIPVTLLSLVLEKGQQGLFGSLNFIIWGWVILLFFINLKVMNNYTVRKTILIGLLGIFTMILVWATVALFFAISSQFFNFIKEVLLEFKMKALG